jgi:two-component system phosphate regulon response regulator PhoB
MDRVLIVDDDPDIRRLVAYNLRMSGFDPVTADSGRMALDTIAAQPPDLIVLDLMLPDIDGNEVCRTLRKNGGQRIPIVMLTARTDEIDRVLGFELGADDYVTKPFSPRELVLRIRSILRRAGDSQVDSFVLGGIRLYPMKRQCLIAGQPVELTFKEYNLLLELAQGRGNVVSREVLLQRVWGYQGDADSRTLDTHIRRLREKLGPEGSQIVTIRGIGFRVANER